MKRSRNLKKYSSALAIAVSSLFCATNIASAFDFSHGGVGGYTDSTTDCNVLIKASASTSQDAGAMVILINGDSYPGGDYWDYENSPVPGVSNEYIIGANSLLSLPVTIPPSKTAITNTDILSACNVRDISWLSQTGPTGRGTDDDPYGVFFTASYFGFTFRATSNVDNLLYDYEYAFVGETNTQLIVRQTPVVFDTTPPSVTLSGAPNSYSSTDPFTVIATFSESVAGFDDLLNDVSISNGMLTAISGGPSAYTLQITPSGSGTVEITVPAGAAQDADNNDNTVSNTLTVKPTEEVIESFMLGRLNLLASNQPDLTRFLMNSGCQSFDLDVTSKSGQLDGCLVNGDTWMEITSAWSETGSYTLGTVGTHKFVNSNLLIGGMLQYDYLDDPANNASGHGFMIGPYFVTRLPTQPLYLEGRLLYGQTKNKINPAGSSVDNFETDRWLSQLRITGEYLVKETTLMPLLDFTYAEDSLHAYTDGAGNLVSDRSVGLLQLTTGIDFSMPLNVRKGELVLQGGISSIYSSTDGSSETQFDAWRGRTHLGVSYNSGSNTTLRFRAFYDGLGSSFESYGADFDFSWKF